MPRENVFHPVNYSNFISEISTLAKCHYPTILSIYGYKEDNSFKIFTEYMEKGSLESFFYNPDKYKELDYDKKFLIGYGIALGMKYLHEQNISHRDLKLSNILINDKYYPIICDFGFLSRKSKSGTFSKICENCGKSRKSRC